MSERDKNGFTLVEIMIVITIISLVLAIIIPNFVRTREVSQRNACRANIKQILSAKSIYAVDNGLITGDTVGDGTVSALVDDYVMKTPVCPAGGTYTLGVVGNSPVCTLGDPKGHSL